MLVFGLTQLIGYRPANDRFRRYLVIAARSGQGLLTEPTTGAQPRRQELVFMPRVGDPSVTRLIDNAIRGAQRGAALTQRMLTYARRQELNLQAVDIPALIRRMTELLERSLGPSVMLETRFPLSLQSVTADPNQPEMALLNLVVNARDAMPEGGPIILSARPETVSAGGKLAPGAYVCLSVVDNGQGMDETTLGRGSGGLIWSIN